MTTVIADVTPVARKAHQCSYCLGTIAAGDKYRRQRGFDCGDAYTYKGHLLCDAAANLAWRELDLHYDDEGPDWAEDVRPRVEAFWEALTTVLLR